jgi:TolA-binding protein
MNSWMAVIGSDPAAILFGVAVVILVVALLGMAISRRARGRPEQQGEQHPRAPEKEEIAIGRWVEEGQQLFHRWPERIERLNELQGHLAAMAQEIERLKAQLKHIDELHAENLRLSQANETLVLDRDELRTVVARIGELIQRASEAPPGVAGDLGAPG